MFIKKNTLYFVLLSLALSSQCDENENGKPVFKDLVITVENVETESASANIGGYIVANGNKLNSYGHCWSKSDQYPQAKNDLFTIFMAATDSIHYTSRITGLLSNNSYYVRAYAVTETDTVYSESINFTTTTTSNVWTQEVPFCGEGRENAVSFTIGDFAYYGLGNAFNKYFDDFFRFNTRSNSWTQLTSFPEEGRTKAVGFAIGSLGYVGLGETPSGQKRDLYSYNPKENGWYRMADYQASERSNAVCFVFHNMVYVGMGNFAGMPVRDFARYIPDNNMWYPSAPFPGERRSGVVAYTVGNFGYLIGSTNSNPKNEFWRYNPSDGQSGAWEQLEDVPFTARRNGISFAVGDYVYVGLGADDLGFKRDLWKFDPYDNNWIQLDNFPGNSRENAIAFTIGNMAFIIGGRNEFSFFDDFWSYQP